MSDCHYMAMDPQKFAKTEKCIKDKCTHIASNVNRMGTENYKLADYEENTETSVFKDAPVNLRANRKSSYVHQNSKNMMKTQNSEANVEYYVTKWEYNTEGQLRKVAQSESFKFDKTRFMPHKRGQMDLQQTTDAQFVYVVNK